MSWTRTFFIHYSSTGFEYVLDLYIVHTLQQYGFLIRPWPETLFIHDSFEYVLDRFITAVREYVLDLYIVHTLQQCGFWIRPSHVHCSYTTAVRVLNTSWTCTAVRTLQQCGFWIRPWPVHCSYTTAVRVFNTSWTCTLFIHYSRAGFEYVLDLYIVHTLQQYRFLIRPGPVHYSYIKVVRVLNTSLTCTLFIHYSSTGFNTSLTCTLFIH